MTTENIITLSVPTALIVVGFLSSYAIIKYKITEHDKKLKEIVDKHDHDYEALREAEHNDIKLLENKVDALEDKFSRSISDLHKKVESCNDKVIDKIDSIKSDFRSTSTCDELRTLCRSQKGLS